MTYPFEPESPEAMTAAKFALLMANLRQVEADIPCLFVQSILRNASFAQDCEQYFFVRDDGKICPVERGLLEWIKTFQSESRQMGIFMSVIRTPGIIECINRMTSIWIGEAIEELPLFKNETLSFEEAVKYSDGLMRTDDADEWCREAAKNLGS